MCIQLRQSFLAFGVVVAVAASLSGLAGHPPTPTTRQFAPRRRELLRPFIFPALTVVGEAQREHPSHGRGRSPPLLAHGGAHCLR